MRIDAGLISGVMLEFVIMLYYANTTLKPKRKSQFQVLCKPSLWCRIEIH